MKVYYDKDADLSLIKGKKVTIVGYGSQGHAHAQNLRDSGVKVIVAELPGTHNYKLAVEHGFQPMPAGAATKQADASKEATADKRDADLAFWTLTVWRRRSRKPGSAEPARGILWRGQERRAERA